MMKGWACHEMKLRSAFRRTQRALLEEHKFRIVARVSNLNGLSSPRICRNYPLLSDWNRTFANSAKQPRDEKTDPPVVVRNRRDLVISWIQQLRSPPNMITSLRILSTPYISYLIIYQQYEWALCGCFAASASDLIDGWMARKFNMTTVLGSYLDPLADKALINVVALSLWYVEILPAPLVALWALKDLGLCIGTYNYVARVTDKETFVTNPATTPLKVSATQISKVNTGLQFITLSVALVQPVYGVDPALLQSFW
jgi:phosphatidylglycerophosphate synthase